MLNALLKTFLREYRTHRMARFTVWVLACGAVLESVDRLAGGVPATLWILYGLVGAICLFYYLGRLVALIRPWRLRWRLIVAYVFIAIVPILLILLLVVLGMFIVGGQFAALLVTADLRERLSALHQLNRAVAHEARLNASAKPDQVLDRLQTFYVNELKEHVTNYPGLEITLRLESQDRAFRVQGTKIQSPLATPAWFNEEEFSGIVTDRSQLALRSIARVPTAAGILVAVLSEPFTPELLDLAGEGIGPVGVMTTRPAHGEALPLNSRMQAQFGTAQGSFYQLASLYSKRIKLPEPANWFDIRVVGASSLDPVSWQGDTKQKLAATAVVYVSSRVMALSRRLLETQGEYSDVYVILFKVVAVILLIIEVIALLIGIRLTRSITHAVDKLYEATEQVKKGDFSYRICVPSNDQLSALGEAFDGMTASVERLLRESEEKLRMQSELEIAREVQTQLFPRSAPEVPGLALYGVCKAARTVSGDYYDFLNLGENRVCLVLGDVSGKGISAALLMAAIQSALRAQFYNGLGSTGGSQAKALSTAEVVGRLNVQLYESTPREKYVTFFFAVYDAASRSLTYTNAGHLPPVLLRRDKSRGLTWGVRW